MSERNRRFQPPAAYDDTMPLPVIPTVRHNPSLPWLIGALGLCVLAVAVLLSVQFLETRAAERAEALRIQQWAEEEARYRFLYRDLIEDYASEQAIDPAFVAAIIFHESRFNPDAVSGKGARGLMQIMEDTGEWIAYRLGELGSYEHDLLFNAETSIRFGTWYLGYLSRMFGGDLVKIAAGYHAGQNAVSAWLKNPDYSSDGWLLETIPYASTDQYVQRVVNATEIYTKHYYPAL